MKLFMPTLGIEVVENDLPDSAAHICDAETVATALAVMIDRRNERVSIAPGSFAERPRLFPVRQKIDGRNVQPAFTVVEFIAPPEIQALFAAATAGVLPLGLRGQAIAGTAQVVGGQSHPFLNFRDRRKAHLVFGYPFLLAQPAAIHGGLKPADLDRGIDQLGAEQRVEIIFDLRMRLEEALESFHWHFLHANREGPGYANAVQGLQVTHERVLAHPPLHRRIVDLFRCPAAFFH